MGSQANILPTASDCQRKLVIRHHNLNPLSVLIKHNLRDLGRAKTVYNKGGSVFGPRNNVYFLALKFVNNSLNTATAHTHTSPNRINGIII